MLNIQQMVSDVKLHVGGGDRVRENAIRETRTARGERSAAASGQRRQWLTARIERPRPEVLAERREILVGGDHRSLVHAAGGMEPQRRRKVQHIHRTSAGRAGHVVRSIAEARIIAFTSITPKRDT